MGETVAFIGLGETGWYGEVAGLMATALAKAGHNVTVFHRTPTEAQAWAKANGGKAAATPAEAVSGATFIAACLVDDDAVRAATTGPGGAFSKIAKGAVFVDHTTISPALARELFDLGTKGGFHYVDAPFAGAVDGARSGTLAIMVGGDAAAVTKAEPFLRSYARKITHMGPAGHGQLTKLTNQIMIASHMQALAEGIFFAEQTGLDTKRVIEAIADGTAASWWMENRAEKVRTRDFDTNIGGVDLISKDMGLVLSEARRVGASLPITAVIAQFWTELQARGQGGNEAVALINLLGKLGGKTR